MDTIFTWIHTINSYAWGVPMLVLILGTGLYLTVLLTFMPVRKLPYGFRMLWRGRSLQGEGDISAFNALMTSLSATIGTGNIAGVATAIAAGGPGALFWMWITALVGMATKYSEAVLAVRYREVDEAGNHVGGPMFYIRNGLGRRWAWMGTAFAVFGAAAGFGIGNTVQANSVADALSQSIHLPKVATGLILAVLAALVLIGGIRRIAQVAGKLVPLMAVAYIAAGVVILALHAAAIPDALGLIVKHAFTPTAATGGFLGAAVSTAIRWGVARGIFSNEAGLGSAPIAHAAASTTSPVRQGVIAMLGTFIDTIVVCSITGLVLVISGVWNNGDSGASLSATAFDTALPGGAGQYIVSFGLAIFAFTTLLGWSYYGEKCVEYLFGYRSLTYFRILWVLAIPLGAVMKLDRVWLIADTLNAFMALPNLVALLLLSPVVLKLTRDYFAAERGAPPQG